VKGFFTRTLAILAGIVLGMLVVSGSGPWRELFDRKPDPAPAAPIQREPAPDTRV
jgi:hypothetical protein